MVDSKWLNGKCSTVFYHVNHSVVAAVNGAAVLHLLHNVLYMLFGNGLPRDKHRNTRRVGRYKEGRYAATGVLNLYAPALLEKVRQPFGFHVGYAHRAVAVLHLFVKAR